MTLKISTGLANALLDTAPLKTAMTLAFIDIYSGAQPANANAAFTGTLLATIDVAGVGVTWGPTAAAGVLSKTVAETWQEAAAIATGTAGWFRIRLTGDAGGLDVSTYKRIDGTIATSGGDMNVGSLTVTAGAPFIISAAAITLPLS
jgi:hypothetical protein